MLASKPKLKCIELLQITKKKVETKYQFDQVTNIGAPKAVIQGVYQRILAQPFANFICTQKSLKRADEKNRCRNASNCC